MGLVANYNSDSDASDHSEEEGAEEVQAPKLTLASLPKPSAAKKRKVVPFFSRLQQDLLRKPIEDDEDMEEDRGKVKRHKQAPKGSSFASLIPKPKLAAEGALGGGLGMGAMGGTGIDLGESEPVAAVKAKAPATAAAVAATAAQGYAQAQEPQYVYEHQVPRQLPPGFYDNPVGSAGTSGLAANVAGPSRPAPAPAPPSEADLMQQAMQEEMYRKSRGKRGADPFRKIEMPQMVEVRQSSLTSMTVAPEMTTGTGKAFGADYAAKLKKEAGDKPESQLRRKHQIGSLFYDAKLRELEMFEGKSKGMKSRAQTQGKYGWV